jgi:two-component system, NarL family, nitrate/nitrite response regulator NarL
VKIGFFRPKALRPEVRARPRPHDRLRPEISAAVPVVIRVAVCAGVRLYCEGLAQALDRTDGIQVVAAVASATAADELRAADPEVVIVDVTGPEGPDELRRIADVVPAAKAVALAVPELESAVLACAEAGLTGFVTRDSSLAELVDAVEHAVRDELVCSPQIAGSLLRRVHTLAARAQTTAASPSRLTRREREIVALIDEGLSNKQIAGRLSIELATVKNHVHNILEKLGVTRRGEAAAALRSTHT